MPALQRARRRAATPPASRPGAPGSTGGWLVNGQKVWTSGAHLAGFGLATIRTDPDVPKHEGITTMVIDMHAEGVEVRPLQMVDRPVGVQRGLLQRRLRPRRRRGRPGQRRLDGGPGDARQRERVHRRRPGRQWRHAGRRRDRALRRAPRAAGGRRRPGRPLRRAERGDGGAQHAQRPPRRRRRRPGTRGQRDQARALGARPRGGGHPGRRSAGRTPPTPRARG